MVGALRCDAPAQQGGTNGDKTPPCLIAFRRLTLCSATGTPQRGISTWSVVSSKTIEPEF